MSIYFYLLFSELGGINLGKTSCFFCTFSSVNAVSFFLQQIQKLCDRVASSTLLDDRRNAVRALKSLSKVCNALLVIKFIKVDISFFNIFILCRNIAWKWVFKQWNILSMFYKQIGKPL